MEWLLWVAASVVGLLAVDRVAVWAERRGWIYWRKRPRGSLGAAAAGPIVEAFNPAHRYVVEERDRRRLEAQQKRAGRA